MGMKLAKVRYSTAPKQPAQPVDDLRFDESKFPSAHEIAAKFGVPPSIVLTEIEDAEWEDVTHKRIESRKDQ